MKHLKSKILANPTPKASPTINSVAGLLYLVLMLSPSTSRAAHSFASNVSSEFLEDETQSWEEDEPASEDAGDAALSPLMREEIAVRSSEHRATKQMLVGLCLGEVYPHVSLGLALQQGPIGLFVGQGRSNLYSFHDPKAEQGLSFDVESRLQTFGLSYSHFVSEALSVAWRTSLSYTRWTGDVSPNAGDAEVTDSDETLSASFDAAGPTLGAAVFWQHIWDSGFVLEWTPVGFRRTWLSSRSVSRAGPQRGAMTSALSRTEVFGFTNVKLGYAF